MADTEFHLLMKRLRTGDHTAAVELLKRYGPVVRHAVRLQLKKKLRSKFDSLDFVQDVWMSFFANPPPRGAFDDQEKLIAFLRQVARNKVADATRQRRAGKKYDVGRELSLESSKIGGPEQIAACQSTPSAAFSSREVWNRLLQGQPLVYRRILILLREGKTPEAIATDLGIHLRTVQRAMAILLESLTP